MDIDDGQAALWNGPAGQAWVEEQALLDRLYRPFEDRLTEVVPAGGAATVLDVGCGAGATTLAIARRLGATGRAIGIDVSAPLIAAARARAEREGLAATFVRDDAQRHAFAPASLDAIVSRFGVMFFQDPEAAFGNLRRAARDGARLRAIVWRSPAENPFMTTAERAAAPLLPALPPRRPDGPGQFAFAERGTVHGILEASGWKAIDIQPLDVPCRLNQGDFERYVSRLGPVGVFLRDADDTTRARVIDTVVAAFESYKDGADIGFTAACWQVDARA